MHTYRCRSGLSQVVSTILIVILGVSAMALGLRLGLPLLKEKIDAKRFRDTKVIAESIQLSIEELIACGYGCTRTMRLSLPEDCLLSIGNYTIQLSIRVSKPTHGSSILRDEPHTTLAWYSRLDSYVFTITLKEYPANCKWRFNTTNMILGRDITLIFNLQANYTIMVTGG